jgi:hypothetical protein
MLDLDNPILQKQIKLRAGLIYIDENNIFITKFNDNIKLETSDIKEIIELYNTMSKFKPMLTLSIAGQFTSVTTEARIYAEKNASTSISEAFVVNSIAQRFLIMVYMKLQRKKHPTKVFINTESAKKWLLNQA